jgi:anti-anti-sigma regulatory factor
VSAQAGLFIHCRPIPGDSAGAFVAVSGPLFLRSAGELRRILTNTLDQGTRRLWIDLGGVTAADPGGLASLVIAARRLQARKNGDGMKFVDVSAACAEVMRRLHLFTDQVAGPSRESAFSPGSWVV